MSVKSQRPTAAPTAPPGHPTRPGRGDTITTLTGLAGLPPATVLLDSEERAWTVEAISDTAFTDYAPWTLIWVPPAPADTTDTSST